MLRAYHNAGLPNRPSPLGSFEQWSDWVRGAIIWLDPCDTMERIRHNDPSRSLLRTVLMRWGANAVAAIPVSASQLIKAASGDFSVSLREIAPDGQGISAVRLGKWLGRFKDRWIDGMRIVEAGERSGSKLWRLERLKFVTTSVF
jgi:putative DNA primase/helicase